MIMTFFLSHFSCVASDSCRVKSDIGQRQEGFDLGGVVEALGEDAVCPNVNMICCHDNDKVKKVVLDYENEETTCSDFEIHGFQ